MKKPLAPLALILTIAMLAAPAVAGTKKIRHRGAIVGVEDSKVTLRVKVKGGRARKVGGFKAEGVPARCDKGEFEVRFEAFDPTRVTKKGNFKKTLKNPDGAKLTISGTVRKRGKRVAGYVKRNRFDGGPGAGSCRVPKTRFKTAKA